MMGFFNTAHPKPQDGKPLGLDMIFEGIAGKTPCSMYIKMGKSHGPD